MVFLLVDGFGADDITEINIGDIGLI